MLPSSPADPDQFSGKALPGAARLFARLAPTVRGQLAGAAMIAIPALAEPLALKGAAGWLIDFVAALTGAAGIVVVFGGLAYRLLEPVVIGAKARGRSLDDALLGLPHAREIWLGLAGVLAVMAVLVVGRVFVNVNSDGASRAGGVVLLGLPGVGLGWTVWRARVMRAPAAAADD